MPILTRKRVNDRPLTWHVYYAGVRVGIITERSGNATNTDQWEWHCGFYPGSEPGEQRYGTSASFEAARVAFEAAWRDFLPKRSEADFQAWRDQEAWTAEKYRRFERSQKSLVRARPRLKLVGRYLFFWRAITRSGRLWW